MKKRNFFSQGNRRWNKLIRQFRNLHRRIVNGVITKQQYYSLVERLNRVYNKLQKMQYKVGIKIAGTSLALMLLTANADAQNFKLTGNLNNNFIEAVGTVNSDRVCADFADIDNDGKMDMVVGAGSSSFDIFKGEGENKFSPITDNNLKTLFSKNSIREITPTFVDIDADGDMDICLTSSHYSTHFIWILKNDGQGNFSDLDTLLNTNGLALKYRATKASFLDVDKDDDFDLYVGLRDGTMIYLENKGTKRIPLFTKEKIMKDVNNDTINVSARNYPTFFDIDKDNDLDLLIGSYYGYIDIYKNEDNKFKEDGRLKDADDNDIKIPSYSNPVFKDLDGNGDLDLFLHARDTIAVKYKNDGTNRKFTKTSSAIEYKLQLGNTRLISPYDKYVFADMDADGDKDIICSIYNSLESRQEKYVLKNDGQGNFSDIDTLKIEKKYSEQIHFSFGDYNGDGNSGLIIPIKNDTLTFFKYDPTNESFSDTTHLLGTNGKVIQIKTQFDLIDIDSDGHLDLIVNASPYPRMFKNDGSGKFDTIPVTLKDETDFVKLNTYYASFSYTDIDADGDIDIMYSSLSPYASPAINIFKQDNNKFYFGGNLDVALPAIRGPYGDVGHANTAFGDIDGDGDDDMLVETIKDEIQIYTREDNATTATIVESGSLLNIFPNPTADIVNIKLSEETIKELTIFDVTGKIVYKSDNNINNSQTQVNISALNRGIYHIRIKTDKNIFSQKIVKK